MKKSKFLFFILFLLVLVFSSFCLSMSIDETNRTIVDKNKSNYHLQLRIQYEINVNNEDILEPSIEARLFDSNEHQKINNYTWNLLINENNYSSSKYSTFYFYESKTGKWDFENLNRKSSILLDLKFEIDTNNTYQNTLPLDKNNKYELYLVPSGGIESNDPKIIELSKKITEGYVTDVDKVKALYKYVSEIDYIEDIEGRGSALKCLQRGAGDCDNKAFLLCALLRAQDIPARPVFGFIHGEEIAHTWVEVYLGQWTNIDPTNKHLFYLPARYVKLASGNGYYDIVTVYYKTDSNDEDEIEIKDLKFEIIEINSN